MAHHLSKHALVLSVLASCTLFAGCSKGTDTASGAPGLSLTERLESGEVRAGVVADTSALFGGISAEGDIGDIKIYNSRVRFIIEAAGESNYYISYGGGIIDADIVRPFGQPGQDLLDDASTMVGIGRMFKAETVEVVNDGSNGEAAVVVATGGSGPLHLLTGSLEDEDIIPDRDVEITTEYILEPDSWLLQVNTHVRWKDVPTLILLADLAFVAVDVASVYQPEVGYQSSEGLAQYGWTSIMGKRNEGAFAFLQGEEDGEFQSSVLLDELRDLGPLLIGPRSQVEMKDGDEAHWSRYIGVGPDVASMTDEWHLRRGESLQVLGGSVTANGNAVPGARVHVQSEEGEIITMAVTDEDGTYTARAPEGLRVSVTPESRGPGIYLDRQPGAGWYSPYAADIPKGWALSSMESGARPVNFSPGHGFGLTESASENTPLVLTEPGQLTVNVADGGPAVVRVALGSGEPASVDPRVVPDRPSGQHAWLYVLDGSGSIPLEPGEYDIVVHRGLTYEAHQQQIDVRSGETATVSVDLVQSVNTRGLWSLDPHTHGSPSADGKISMSGRLIVNAAHGIDVHFGTDHDHIADYRELLRPLGIHRDIASIVSDEVSPITPGHHNAYPLEIQDDAVNGGAANWWTLWNTFENTDDLYTLIRQMQSDGDVIIQANHPTSSAGLFKNSGWAVSSGQINVGHRWSENFDAFEVLNSGSQAVVPHYLDMLNRGLSPTPVGVSDSHSHTGGIGASLTWVPIDIERIDQLTNDHIRDAIRSGGTIASHGPLIVATINGEWAPGTIHTESIDVKVEIHTPSWMQVDTLHVYENGTIIHSIPVEDSSMTIPLEPEQDAVYVLMTEGAQDMSPVYPGARPWALTQAFFIDVAGDGWEPPLPPLTIR